jgi:hypothetical protein
MALSGNSLVISSYLAKGNPWVRICAKRPIEVQYKNILRVMGSPSAVYFVASILSPNGYNNLHSHLYISAISLPPILVIPESAIIL